MQHRDIVFLKGLLVLFMKDNLKYTLQHKIQIDANGKILSVLDVKRKYLVKANKKYRLLLNIPLLFTFIFVYKVMIAVLYQKVPSDSKFNLIYFWNSPPVINISQIKFWGGWGHLKKNICELSLLSYTELLM